MPRKHRQIRAALAEKGFIEDPQRRHIVFVYRDLQGRTTTARTMLSQGAASTDVHDGLIAQMARQVGLDRRNFLRLIDCPMSRSEYDALIAVREEGEDG